ncbi:dual OB domain-containing protein [Candidatus Poriferisodalis sp.]|uniref:dual OB domain-containing protein n=1 Tax=Candidatus Poriferisodalis sp. TaxID=3101277 RepID=UPI003B01A5EE
MSRTELLCLANSWKLGGRCFAGLANDGSWVRPVTDTSTGTLPNSACVLNTGRVVEALDVVKLKLKRPEPRLYQPENWVVGNKEWHYVKTQTLGDVGQLLDSVRADDSPIFGTRTDSVSWQRIQESPPAASLTLIRTSNPHFYVRRKPNGSNQTRVKFVHGDSVYDLSISFELALPHNDTGSNESPTDWYLTISLGEPFEEQHNRCYKLVAGALEIPR